MQVFTEENPQEAEIVAGLSRLGHTVTSCQIAPVYDGDVFHGVFAVKTSPEPVECNVQLFRGTTSSVDYLFIKPGHLPLLMESTKTLNADSRNSSVFQRIVKFLVATHYYPEADRVMFYTLPPTFTSKTAAFGLRLFATLGITVASPSGAVTGAPFTSAAELIADKNAIPERGNNVSVRLAREGSTVTIRGRLNKTRGRMDYDPNIGLFTAMIRAMDSLEPGLTYRVIDHGLAIDAIRMDNKFWYALRGIAVTLDGHVPGISCLPAQYLTQVVGTEKTSTILFQHHSGLRAVFHNHAGCQRSSLVAPDGTTYPVPKDITMPDVVLIDETSHTLYLTEGKDTSKLQKAQAQVDALGPFEALLARHYPEFICRRGLCLHMDTPKESLLRYPVWFRLFPDGRFANTLHA